MKKELKNHWDGVGEFMREGAEIGTEIDLEVSKGKALQKLYRTRYYKDDRFLKLLLGYFGIVLVVLVIYLFVGSFDSGYNYAQYLYNTTGMIP